MDDKNFYGSFDFLNENLTLSEIEKLEKISLPTAAVKECTNIFSSEFGKGFEYGHIKPLFTELVRSISENIQTLVFCTDLASFGPYFKTAVRTFSRMDLTIVNKSIT